MYKLYSLLIAFLLVAATLPVTAPAQTKRAMTLDDMFKVKRVTDPQISPDGQTVAFVVTIPNLEANNTNSDIYVMPVAGGEPKQLTDSPKADRHPRWSPDGKWILFESSRGGSMQIYKMPSDGGSATQVTTISTEASGAIWSPDGKQIAFVSGVYPEFSSKPFAESDKLNKDKLDAKDASKVKAHIMTQLLYRHWDSWVDDLRQHVFVMNIDGGTPKDVTPGENDGVPTSDTFSAGDEYDFSPDGMELAFTAPPFPTREQAWRTNHDIFTVNIATGEKKQITTNPAADGAPHYSPDGKYIGYRAQSRPNFEADRWQLMVYDRATGKSKSLTPKFDSGIDNFTWMPDSKSIILEAEDKGTKPLWTVPSAGGEVKMIVPGDVSSGVTISADGKVITYSRSSFTHPTEVYTAHADGGVSHAVTTLNDDLINQIDFTQRESMMVEVGTAERMQMWIIKPPHFDSKKKYPLVYWVHGGPQGAWMSSWSYRWNPEIWAAQGYVLALPNPHGSTGFGQKYTDEISHDWGGQAYKDVMAGLAVMEKQPYIDNTRMAAAGASYGGYMMNWLEGHTTKFKTIITHDGVFNFSSMYGTTEEIWFDEWEHGIPWKTKDYGKFSPDTYAANFKTPMLVIHSEKDYRVPVDQGMQLFTALQRQNIPSKFLSFPDEGHWVLKPANSQLWHKTIFDWLADYLK